MPNTTKGLPYPNATDPVAQGAAAIQALAVAVDAKLEITGRVSSTGTIVAGTGFTVTKGSAGNYTITFTTPFAALPRVFANAEVAGMAANVSSIAVGSCVVSITDVVSNAGSDRQFCFEAAPIY